MARQNSVFLYARVAKKPQIRIDETGNSHSLGTCHLRVIRGPRDVGDKRRYVKVESPIIMTNNENLIHEMETWEENDMVYVKGTIASKNIMKSSICPHCGSKNKKEGQLVFVLPIFAKKVKHCESKEECMEELMNKREISDIALIIASVCREPKMLKTDAGLIITQYQVALNRKYRVQNDPPEIKTDYPWVKSYGANAREDKKRLRIGSVAFYDGYLQARVVHRTTKCEICQEFYNWDDKAMEIVPYETEYMKNCKTDEEIAQEAMEKLNKIKAQFSQDGTGEDDDFDNMDQSSEPLSLD